MKEIKDDVKAFRKAADDSEEVASTLAKDVLKIARRIEYASIFPPVSYTHLTLPTIYSV